jgi:predicted acylesterase/phospholipase RssA
MAKRRRRVFILGGGAALGAHHVGALKFLEEQGIRPDVIVASSIGVINACVYATGGVAELERAWGELRSLPLLLTPSFRDNPIFGTSLLSSRGLTRALERYMDFTKILESPIDLRFILLNLSRGRGELWGPSDCENRHEVRSIVRAGYAIPFLLPPVRFRGEEFADGGFAWNVPLDYALSLGPTEIFILAPIASELPFQRSFRTFIDFSLRVADVLWRTIGNMGYIYAPIENGMLHGIPITVIEPGEQWSGFGPLTLFHAHPRKSERLMAAGYRDAKRALAARRRKGFDEAAEVERGAEEVGAGAALPLGSNTKVVSIGRHRQ